MHTEAKLPGLASTFKKVKRKHEVDEPKQGRILWWKDEVEYGRPGAQA